MNMIIDLSTLKYLIIIKKVKIEEITNQQMNSEGNLHSRQSKYIKNEDNEYQDNE